MVPLSGRGKVFIPAPDRCDVTADTSWRERELKEHDLLRPSRLGDREGGEREREWARERGQEFLLAHTTYLCVVARERACERVRVRVEKVTRAQMSSTLVRATADGISFFDSRWVDRKFKCKAKQS